MEHSTRSTNRRIPKAQPRTFLKAIRDRFAGPARPMSQADVDATTKRFRKAMVERMLGGEVTHHLGILPAGRSPSDTSNQRHGTSSKAIPRHSARTGWDVRGAADWQARAAVQRLRRQDPGAVRAASPSARSRRASPRRTPWRSRRTSSARPDRRRGVLGIWIEQPEGAKFWMKVFTDLKSRGCQDR